jgi:hypothetical protein
MRDYAKCGGSEGKPGYRTPADFSKRSTKKRVNLLSALQRVKEFKFENLKREKMLNKLNKK